MRCRTCGWMNADGVEICVKCQNPVKAAPLVSATLADLTEEEAKAKKTVVIRNEAQPVASKRVKRHCPNCGYPVWDDMTICPQCKYTLEPLPEKELKEVEFQEKEHSEEQPFEKRADLGLEDEASLKKTYNPYVKARKAEVRKGPKVTLLTQKGEGKATLSSILYGNVILLGKTGEGTESIQEAQAALTFEDGQWYLENRGDEKSTFLLVSRKTPVQAGDIILINEHQCQISALGNGDSDNQNDNTDNN